MIGKSSSFDEYAQIIMWYDYSSLFFQTVWLIEWIIAMWIGNLERLGKKNFLNIGH